MLEQLIAKTKLALPVSTDAFDNELADLVLAGLADLGIAGVLTEDKETDPLVARAVITYCKCHWGDLSGADLDRMLASYKEQKAQLSMATGYTNWGDGQ